MANRVGALEHRQVTVLFCDVVGWTSLTQRVDPEELYELRVSYQQRCSAIVSRHEGLVTEYLGDGVVAYFGYPDAHEDAGERAIRAALEIVAKDERASPLVEFHIGIATGSVLIGDVRENQPLGQAPNLAARLLALAQPGTIVVSETTRRLCRGVFEYVNLGRHQLKGFDDPVQAWQIVREGRAETRFQALRAAELTPLVNRRAELAEIDRAWQSAKTGHPVTLLISGEPGIGKSRIVDEVAARCARDGAVRIRFSCSSYLTSSPLAPVIRQLSRAAEFSDEDDDREKLRKLDRMVAFSGLDANETVPLLATLLSIGYEGVYPPLVLSPQRQRQRLFEVLVHLVKATAERRPVLFVIEDLHWIDPSSQELLGMTIAAVAQMPVLAILTSRPEVPEPWRQRPDVTEMRLATLDRADSLQMIESLCRGHVMPPGATAAIADRADGLPLFIEDLTKDILEMSALQPVGPTHGRGQNVSVPDTLRDTLMSRLDRLGSAKQAAQIAAVIGREFSFPLLARVADRADDDLQEHMRRLVASGLVAERRSAGAVSYEFKHALVRDAAHASLLNRERVVLHARIAHVLVTEFSQTADEQPEMLAYHLQSAGDIDRAIALWISAAKLSARRSGFVEAIAHLNEALRLCAGSDSNVDRLRLELRVHLALGGIYAEHRGFSSLECSQAYNRALDLCHRLGDAPQIFAALSGVGSFEITRGNLPRARALGEECMRLAQKQPSRAPFVMGHLLVGGTMFLGGQLSDSRRHLDEAIRLYDEDRASRTGKQVLYVQDQKSTGLCYLGLGLTIMGHLDAGLAAAKEGVNHARALGAIHAMNFSLCYLGGVYHLRRDAEEALECATKSLELAREQGFATWRGASQIMRGDALMSLGKIDEGFAEIEAGVNAHSDIDAVSYRTFSVGVLARGLLAIDRVDEALRAVEEGIMASDQRQERFYLAELLRLKGDALAMKGRVAEADRWLRESIAVAAEQEAKLFQLRSAVSLCKLHGTDSCHLVAEQLLPVCSWFAPDVIAPDLTAARSLLATA